MRASVVASSHPQIAPGEPALEATAELSIAESTTASRSRQRRLNAAPCQPVGGGTATRNRSRTGTADVLTPDMNVATVCGTGRTVRVVRHGAASIRPYAGEYRSRPFASVGLSARRPPEHAIERVEPSVCLRRTGTVGRPQRPRRVDMPEGVRGHAAARSDQGRDQSPANRCRAVPARPSHAPSGDSRRECLRHSRSRAPSATRGIARPRATTSETVRAGRTAGVRRARRCCAWRSIGTSPASPGP